MSKVKRTKVTPGDVFGIATSGGLAYFQYITKHPVFGQLIRVLPGLYKKRPAVLDSVINQKEKFLIYFPITAAMSKALISKVEKCAIPEWAKTIPPMRRAGMIDAAGKVHTWSIEFEEQKTIVKKLTEAQRKLSLIEIWNDTLLAERICSGWTPYDEI